MSPLFFWPAPLLGSSIILVMLHLLVVAANVCDVCPLVDRQRLEPIIEPGEVLDPGQVLGNIAIHTYYQVYNTIRLSDRMDPGFFADPHPNLTNRIRKKVEPDPDKRTWIRNTGYQGIKSTGTSSYNWCLTQCWGRSPRRAWRGWLWGGGSAGRPPGRGNSRTAGNLTNRVGN